MTTFREYREGDMTPARGRIALNDETLRDGLQSPSVKTPSTSVAKSRIPRRIRCREARDFAVCVVRRCMLGMQRLSTLAMLTSH